GSRPRAGPQIQGADCPGDREQRYPCRLQPLPRPAFWPPAGGGGQEVLELVPDPGRGGKHGGRAMKIGLNLVPVSLDKLADAARVSEELGFESGWIGEHIVLPMKPRAPYPYGEASFRPDTPFLEPFVALAHLATVTEKLRLGTGICILPGRQFFATARAITTLDNISRGRLDLGVGTGWSEDEFELLGADFHQRGAVMDEFLDALDALWQQQHPSFHGKYLDFDNLGFAPKPVQKPRVPVHVGGFAPAALRRAAVRGDGWYGSAGSPEEARNSIDTINNLL